MRKIGPAEIMIGVGGVILALALWWLMATPSAGDALRVECEAQAGRVYVETRDGRGFCVSGERMR